MEDIVNTLVLFFPAYIANMMPLLAYKIKLIRPLFELRIDFGYKFLRKDLFGSGKTWMGMATGIIGGGIAALLLNVVGVDQIAGVDINLYYGILMGFGALFGDLVKSFIKRRFDVKSGKPFVPFDQIDFVIGSYLFSFLLVKIELINFVIALLITPALHLLVNIVAFKLKFKKVWW